MGTAEKEFGRGSDGDLLGIRNGRKTLKLFGHFALGLALCFGFSAPALAQQAGAPATAGTPASVDDAAAARIARLIEVWGFVKYHHPDAQSGAMAPDAEFFGLYPAIRDAASQGDADRLLAGWLTRIGAGAPCDPCAELPEDVAIASPTPDWLESGELPPELAAPLRAIYDNRSGAAANVQISGRPGVGNPLFTNEIDYSHSAMASEQLRMLALARYWTMLRYWFPYRDMMDHGPDALLDGAVADFANAADEQTYREALGRLARASGDGHAGIPALEAALSRPGECVMPHFLRYIEGRPVIGEPRSPAVAVEALQRGDIVIALGSEAIEQLEARYRPFVAASNRASEDYLLTLRLSSGPCEAQPIVIERDGEQREIMVEWAARNSLPTLRYGPHDRAGEGMQWLADGEIAYLKASDFQRSAINAQMEEAAGAQGLIIDLRGYPTEFLVFDLGRWLVSEPTPFVSFTFADYATPGLFRWGGTPSLRPDPQGRRLAVPVVALIDESAVSQTEYHAMALRAAGVTLIGSRTAGADGNVSLLTMPLGEEARISGIGIFYPDRTPTQRVGLVPDIEVTPTIEGYAAGRDEVLERAVAELQRTN